MPTVHVANPWGRAIHSERRAPAFLQSYDVQRGDLWQLDLSGVVNALSQQLLAVQAIASGAGGAVPTAAGRMLAVAQNLPVANEALYYAQAVDLSELRVDTSVVPRDTLPYLMPGMDVVPGTVRVVFLVDAGAPVPARGSQLLSLLFAWRAASRAGRGSFDGGFADQDDYELAWGLADTASGSLQPEYRFDVPVSLLQGGSTQVFVDTPGGPGRLGVRRMEVASTLKLRQMWMSGAQPSGLQYSGAAAAWTVSATFACSGWLPIPLQNQLY